jgi:diazepam-binding inhibitor (GABA receptor modulating acyl-CoA-binding protein)
MSTIPFFGESISLQAQFEQAQADSKTLSERPDNMTMLKLYSLYKQGSSGDVQGERPGMTDFGGRAKWDAWNELKGTSEEAAQQQYIHLVEGLKD